MHDNIICSKVRLWDYGDTHVDRAESVCLIRQQGYPAILGLGAVEQLTESQDRTVHGSACCWIFFLTSLSSLATTIFFCLSSFLFLHFLD